MATSYATDAEIIAAIPAVAGVAVGVRDHYRLLAEQLINLEAWGTKASFGHIQLTAHMLAMTQPGISGGGGAVSSRTLGRLSVSYASGSVSDSELSTTSYGRAYVALRDTLPAFGVPARSLLLSLGD